MAELVQPRMALKTPQPEPPLVFGLQHYKSSEDTSNTEKAKGKPYIDVPDALRDVVGSRAIAHLIHFAATELLGPGIGLERPDGPRHQSCRDEVQETRRSNQKELESCR